jgi:RNA-directed DNA polymerase
MNEHSSQRLPKSGFDFGSPEPDGFPKSKPDFGNHGRYCRNLAAALLHGPWTAAGLHKHGTAAVGPRKRWLKPLLERVLGAFPEPPRAKPLVAFLQADVELAEARRKHRERHGEPLIPAALFHFPERMQPAAAPLIRPVPVLETEGQLAAWLGIPAGRLLWYADLKGINRTAAEYLRHYIAHWLPKRTPGAYRLLEEPKPVLKSIQRQILIDILGCLAPHEAAHGFRTGRSTATNAREHCGRAVVVRFDLRDFFPSVPAAKVAAVFDAMGYPPRIARLLTGLCTTRLPRAVWESKPGPRDESDHAAWVRLSLPHLPQGAPTSPALANLCAYALDCRLAALARNLDASYTRYADDLTFSGPANLPVARLQRSVMGICAEEGFAQNPAKTRIQRQSSRQIVAGVVVNVRPNVPREDFDELKAILTNCARHGPEGQNRDNRPDFRAYLSGRIAYVAMLHPKRGGKLWRIFDRIEWK